MNQWEVTKGECEPRWISVMQGRLTEEVFEDYRDEVVGWERCNIQSRADCNGMNGAVFVFLRAFLVQFLPTLQLLMRFDCKRTGFSVPLMPLPLTSI